VGFQRIISGINVFSLMAIPFFIFAGELMFHGGIAMRLVRFASAAVGAVRGGLGIVNVFSSMLFGGISGSAIADISALGSILVPVMKDKGYDADYAVNVTVTSSIAGIIIPPSHNMIIFAIAAGGGISISKLFLAGVVPGVLMCLCLAAAAYVVAVKRGYRAERFPGWQALAFTFFSAIPGLLTAVIIVGGVLSGVFTVTESGAFGAIYAFLVTLLVYRNITWANFKIAVSSSVKTTSMVMILIACAAAFGLAPAACAMIGDSLHDLHAARAAGMTAIAVLTGLAARDSLAPHADLVLDHIGALPDWLDEQGITKP